jgi:hypothetical protein
MAFSAKPGLTALRPFLLLSFASPVRAGIEWDTLITRSRELSMSGALGLLETDILYAEPGTEQPELWRILQSMVGIGSLRVASRICEAPCWEFLHSMYGTRLPESVEARNFWLNQPSWTEMSKLGMSHEDTSYHRINQGSGPQLKVLWTWDDIAREQAWWEGEDDQRRGSMDRRPSDFLVVTPVTSGGSVRERRGSRASDDVRAQEVGDTPSLYTTRRGQKISEGTTDKWFMDRWQCEVLAVACHCGMTIGDASSLLTVAYFGNESSVYQHSMIGGICFILAAGTFVTAAFSDWSWIAQFVSLTSLGYFANRTASLRAWRFVPSAPLRDILPELLHQWPSEPADQVLIRIGVQSSGFCHLRGLASLPAGKMKDARAKARTMRGRWKSNRRQIRYSEPYAENISQKEKTTNSWLSYEVQSSWFGLVSTLEPDNVHLRSASVAAIIMLGVVLLILGFGGTIATGFNPVVLGVYAAGIVSAILSRGRREQWTMPEFEAVDLTCRTLPPAILNRVRKMKDLDYLGQRFDVEEREDKAGVFESRIERGESNSIIA